MALCTLSRAPVVYLLDPSTGEPLASLDLPAGGNVFGGVHAYIRSLPHAARSAGAGD